MDLKAPENLIYLVGRTYAELGSSEYYRSQGFIGRSVPQVRLDEAKNNFSCISKAVEAGLVMACHDLSEGGLAVTAAEMAFSGDLGLDLWLNKFSRSESLGRDDFVLFSESNSRFLVEVSEKVKEDFEAAMKGSNYSLVGKTKKDQRLTVYGLGGKTVVEATLDELRNTWRKPFGG
jgi:phosphoribosylformylglycinamidine synthase